MLLESCTITQFLPCIADPTKIRVIASFSNHVEDVFPYLNAILKNIAYVPAAKTITMKKDHRLITIYPHMVTIAKADDEEDAKATLQWLQDLINGTWERRDSITPSYEVHQLLRPLPSLDVLESFDFHFLFLVPGSFWYNQQPATSNKQPATSQTHPCPLPGGDFKT